MVSRPIAAVLIAALLSACTTPRMVRLDTGQGKPLEYQPPTTSRAVRVLQESFEEALARLMLAEPLVLRPATEGWLVRTSSMRNAGDTSGQYWLGKGLGGLCRPGQSREGCISLLDDVLELNPWEKLALGLGMSLGPMRESIARALQDTFTPQFFAAAIGAGMVSWVLLAANPEPVFTKVAAVVAALMVIYLGVDSFLAMVKACQELKRASDQAVTLEELEEAGQRFGSTVGPHAARVFILAVTVAVSRGTMGSASWLAARLPLLPNFAEASAVGASQVGVRLASVGQVSVVAVVEGNLVITLAPTAVAMAASGNKGKATPSAVSSGTGFNSFDAFKDAMGAAGQNKNWHHIVEQTSGNVQRFGPRAVHNTDNLIIVEEEIHWQLSGLYSSKRPYSQGMTVRQWLSTQSFEAQRAFGLKTLRDFGVIP